MNNIFSLLAKNTLLYTVAVFYFVFNSNISLAASFSPKYQLENTYYTNFIANNYQKEYLESSCKTNADLRQIEVSDIVIEATRPVSQKRIEEIEDEATYLAVYKALLGCYSNSSDGNSNITITNEDAKRVFSNITNIDIARVFVEKNKTYKVLPSVYQASFYFLINKDALDFLIWKYGQKKLKDISSNGYVAFKIDRYDVKDIAKIEEFFNQNNITFNVLEYRYRFSIYNIKIDENFEQAKQKLAGFNINPVETQSGQFELALEAKTNQNVELNNTNTNPENQQTQGENQNNTIQIQDSTNQTNKTLN